MKLALAFLVLTVATTLGTGAAAVLWARFVGQGMDERDAAEPAHLPRLDVRTW